MAKSLIKKFPKQIMREMKHNEISTPTKIIMKKRNKASFVLTTNTYKLKQLKAVHLTI